MKITFLVHSLYTIGGTIRTTLNTATALADRGHDIEIASVFRHRTTPLFSIDPRFSVVTLVDARSQAEPLSPADTALAAKPSKVFPATEPRYDQYHRYADAVVKDYLAGSDADVIVGTRPGLNVYLAEFAPGTAVLVGQEHLFLDHHGRRLSAKLYKAYRKLDALTTVSSTDAKRYREKMPRIAGKVSHIPNSIPATPLEPSDHRSHTIVAAGRLEKVKRYDLLLHAFARVVADHPDWRLRIYGHGKESASLRALSESLGLHNSVRMMGTFTPIDAEWVKGSIAAVTSDLESFGLTIVEAMDCGLPVVSTACPYGPPEIIDNGVDGILTPPGDVEAFAAALNRLIEDEPLRESMALAARKTAQRYSPQQVAGEYEDLFTTLLRAQGRTVAPVSAATAEALTEVSVSSRAESFAALSLQTSAAPEAGLSLVRGQNQVPLLPTGTTDATAIVDQSILDDLAEGIWTVHIGDDPARADRIDNRALVDSTDLPPRTAAIAFSHDDALAVRVWRREVYAEVEGVDWDGDTFTVSGRLLGGVPGGAAIGATVSRRKTERRLDAKVTLTGTAFALSVDTSPLLAEAATGSQLWDLWIRLNDADVRLTRVFDDIGQRKKSHRLPGVDRSGGRRRVQPYFTVDNELSIKISDVVEPQP